MTKFAVFLGIGVGLSVPIFYRFGVIHRNMAGFCFVAMATGLIAWLVGLLFEQKLEDQLERPGGGKSPAQFSFTLLNGIKYWGLALLISTGSLASFEALRHRPHKRHKAALAMATPVKARAAAEVEAKPNVKPEVKIERKVELPVVFPPLQLKGLTRNGAKSSALINGHVVFVGERIDDVVLLAVGDNQVTVGLGGQTKELTLRK